MLYQLSYPPMHDPDRSKTQYINKTLHGMSNAKAPRGWREKPSLHPPSVIMCGMKIVLLGAAGFVGRTAAQALAARPEIGELLLVDYVVRDAKRLAKALSPRCRWAMADIGRAPDLERLLDGADAVASAVGPCAQYEKGILSTCAAKGIPVASIGDGTLSPADRREIHNAFRRKGAAAVSGCGMMPGWTELLSAHFPTGGKATVNAEKETVARRFLYCRIDRFGGYAFFRRVVKETGRAGPSPPSSLPACWFTMGEDLFGLPPGLPSSLYRRISSGLGFLGAVGEELSAAFLFWLRGSLKSAEGSPVSVAGTWTGEENGGGSAVIEDAQGRLAGALLAETVLRLAGRAVAENGLLPLHGLIGREDAERISRENGGRINAG